MILIFILSGCSADMNKKAVKRDKLLSKLSKKLPLNWQIYFQAYILNIKRKNKSYVLSENRINAPAEPPEKRIKRIKENGELVNNGFEFYSENKWDKEKLKEVKQQNKRILKTIDNLRKKYGIEKLEFKTPKGNYIPVPNLTEKQKERFEKFKEKKQKLLENIIKLPDYNSANYSLFLKTKIGMQDSFTLVYPEKASEEMYKVEELIKKNLVDISLYVND